MMIKKLIQFLTTDIWRIRLKQLSRGKSFFVKQLRILLVVFREFTEDKCQLRASALTYYSLLSIVPVLAMAFGVAKGFGFERILEEQLLDKFAAQEEVVSRMIEFATILLGNTRGGMIAGIGVALLFWTVIKVLGNIEKSFNDIWGVKQPRPFARKFSDYLSIMFICPVLVIASSSITVFISTQILRLTEHFALVGLFNQLLFFFLKLLPYAMIWILFSFIYIFMPNTKVKFSYGLIAGIVAGSIYQIVQWLYISFQVGVARYNAIYGSFAALPLFLVWLQLSWLIVLFGAEISFAYQNIELYELEPDCLKVNNRVKRRLALGITHLAVQRLVTRKVPLTASEISHQLEIPIRLVRQLLFELTEAGILIEVKSQDNKDSAYQPASDVCRLTIKDVVDALDRRGSDSVPVAQTQVLTAIDRSMNYFDSLIEHAPENKLLKDLA